MHVPPLFHAHQTLCRLLSDQTRPEFHRRADPALPPSLSSDDWHLLAATARREGVAPVLYHGLKGAGWLASVPPDVQGHLRQACYATMASNLLLYRELFRILTALSTPPQSPIPTIILKGAALAATVYDHIGLRPMGDLDLLVPEERLAEAAARLKALGYVEPYPEMAPGLNLLAGHHVHLQGGQDITLAVELHWTLIGGEHDWRPPSLPWFWSQTEALSLTPHRGVGVRALTLTPTAHLLYLSAHLMLQHGEARSHLRWFYDIHLLIEREGQRIQWDEVVARAKGFRWAAAVYAALKGAHDRFGTRLPPGLLEALAEASDPQARRLVARRAAPLQTRATGVLDVASALSPRGRLRLLLAIAFPNPAYMRWRYKLRPAWLWPLCYPYRWLDILREGLTTIWRLARRR